MTLRLLVLALLSGCGTVGGGSPADGDSGTVVRRDGGGPGPGEDGGTVLPGEDAGAPRPGEDAGRPPTPSECALPEAFDVGVAYARTLHVSTGGSDGGDGSEGSPFATIDRALSAATPGTRILVHAGTYGPFDADGVSGEAGSPIAIVADGAVTLEARGAGAVISMSDPEYVVIEGFTLADAQIHGMNIDDGGSYDSPAHHFVLRNITIPSAGTGGNNDCIKLSGVDDFWVLDSDVAQCNRGEIIDMVGCHRGVIAGNHFHDTVQSGVQTKGGSADVLIQGNLFEDIPSRAVNAGGGTGAPYYRPADATAEALRIRVIGNVFARVGAEGGAAVAYIACDACVAAHNTIVDPRTWVVRIVQESSEIPVTPSRNGLFVNNVIVMRAADVRTIVNIGGGTQPETFTFGSNLWYAYDQGAGWSPDIADPIPPETDSLVQVDPMMIDREGGNYALAAGSPAIGQARDVGALPPDFSGRCYASPASLGAFEVE
jgi:hypothetical protein